jgi:hypothetical protein
LSSESKVNGFSQKPQMKVLVLVTLSAMVVTLSRGRCVTTYPWAHPRGEGGMGGGELTRLFK